jgi:hypothetical protein
VLQASRGTDFPLEAFRSEGCRQLRVQHLERHVAIVLEIVGQVHRSHAAASQLSFKPVAVLQGLL